MINSSFRPLGHLSVVVSSQTTAAAAVVSSRWGCAASAAAYVWLVHLLWDTVKLGLIETRVFTLVRMSAAVTRGASMQVSTRLSWLTRCCCCCNAKRNLRSITATKEEKIPLCRSNKGALTSRCVSCNWFNPESEESVGVQRGLGVKRWRQMEGRSLWASDASQCVRLLRPVKQWNTDSLLLGLLKLPVDFHFVHQRQRILGTELGIERKKKY